MNAWRPSDAWYLHDPLGVHGLGHAARVLIWADRISSWMLQRNEQVDRDVVLWAAALHDVRRVDDGDDIEHGARAARWIRSGGAAERLNALTDLQRERLAYCCEWHVPSDSQAPEMTPELVCLKDADGLDRVRLGDLDSSHLRTFCARRLSGAAQALFDRSEGILDANLDTCPWEAVRIAAI
jgi:uncharacterized protein